MRDPLDDLAHDDLLDPPPNDERPDDPETDDPPVALLMDIKALSALLDRSVASLERDVAAGRLPAAIRLGGSRKWRVAEIEMWVDAGCPARAVWERSTRTNEHRTDATD